MDEDHTFALHPVNIVLEMTHFRPIRLVPISIRNSSMKILKIPPIRLKVPKNPSVTNFKPAKSKFKQKLTSTHRRSAFYVVSPAPSKVTTTSNGTKTKVNINVNSNLNNICESNEQSTVVASQKSTKLNNVKSKATLSTNLPPKVSSKPVISNRRSRNRVTNHVLQENAVHKTVQSSNTDQKDNKMLKQNREQMLLQEKEDFQLATLLQGYENTSHLESNNRSIRYSLRSRGKMSSITNVSDCNRNGIHNNHDNTHSLISNDSNAQLTESEAVTQNTMRKRKTTNVVCDSNAIITRKTRRKY